MEADRYVAVHDVQHLTQEGMLSSLVSILKSFRVTDGVGRGVLESDLASASQSSLWLYGAHFLNLAVANVGRPSHEFVAPDVQDLIVLWLSILRGHFLLLTVS